MYEIVEGIFYRNDSSSNTSFVAGDETDVLDDIQKTSTSIVNRMDNHTLTAIWEANEYTVSYELKLGAKLSMEELGFMLAMVIKEMDKSGHCAKEDMLKLINTHLG